jgi:hypothetical protein
VQAAFREHHGLQCGFCTPGMIMAAVDMINRARRQSLDEQTIRHELEGNICRCTGYHNIVKAIKARRGRDVRHGRRGREISHRSRFGRKPMGIEGIGARVVRKEDSPLHHRQGPVHRRHRPKDKPMR